jgi:hypothetical protein
LKKKTIVVALLLLMSVTFLFMPLSMVLAQVGVNIYLINPEEQGFVTQEVNVQGTINTNNGPYQIWFGNILVANNTAEGYYINANFAIPELPGGTYTIILRDVTRNVNATKGFSILPAYYIKPLVTLPPSLLQQGSDVVLNISLTGGQPNTNYNVNLTVMLPAPLNTNYSKLITLPATSSTGTTQLQLVYPDEDFQPADSITDYTGLYHVYINQTQMLAGGLFFVGFTDLSEYHREQNMTIRAIGYQPNETATMTVIHTATGSNVHSEMITASSGGLVTSSWIVPSDMEIGDYSITIIPQTTAKPVPDSQLFSVPGYSVKVRTFNLAGDLVPQIFVEALDHAANKRYNSTSGDDGVASLNLEGGTHTLSAFWNDVKVGEVNTLIIGESALDLLCELTNLKITVKNANGNLIPFVNLQIIYQYVTTKDSLSRTGSLSGQTDISGNFVLSSILPEIGYTVNASLYGAVFNAGNNTVTSLPAQSVYEVIILCPSQTLALKIVDYHLAAIPDARIELFEITNGLFQGALTDTAGVVTVEVTFGMYRLRVYKDNVLLNETVIQVFNDTQREIHCFLYNIDVAVMVVDYFGQPLANINVVFYGPGIESLSATTQTDGTATFSNVVGGNTQIIAYPEGLENSYEAFALYIDEPTVIQVKMAKYVLFRPFLIESSILATIIMLLLATSLFMTIEIFRRTRAKPAK